MPCCTIFLVCSEYFIILLPTKVKKDLISSFCVLVLDEADFKIPKASFSICNFGSRFSFLLGGPDCAGQFGGSEVPSAPAACSLSSRSVVLLT